MKRFQLGIIGIGRIGAMHTENIVRNVPGFEVRAVASPKIDQAWAKALGIAHVHHDAGNIFDDDEIGAVAICTNTHMHVELVERAIAAGKHIFCEKPIALDGDVLARLGAAAREASVRLMVGLNRRFDGNFVRIRDVVARGDIGTPHLVRITNRDPRRPDLEFVETSGGLFMDFTVHDFDMARYVTGCEVVEVFAVGAALVDPAIGALGDIDTALVTLVFDSGALGVIDNSREAVYGYDQRVEVFGTKGGIEARNTTPTATVLRTADRVISDAPWPNYMTRYKETYIAEMTAFARCLAGDTEPPVGIDDIRKAVLIAQAAQHSLAKKRPVAVAS